ncbi:hypothetical protein TIFTF001_024456 [Ficus carica]|uniref:Uncharacterized protein n=1 Tax=Ficus carica TaxID=3494 RepID=A0AA88AVQ3_FICCA|nr:hypothetical protein TIFTF001_024456 [Ficus carica]
MSFIEQDRTCSCTGEGTALVGTINQERRTEDVVCYEVCYVMYDVTLRRTCSLIMNHMVSYLPAIPGTRLWKDGAADCFSMYGNELPRVVLIRIRSARIRQLEHLRRRATADERPVAAHICWLAAGCSGPFIRCSLHSGFLCPGSHATAPVWRAVACSQAVSSWNEGCVTVRFLLL